MALRPTEIAFLQDLALAKSMWIANAKKALVNPEAESIWSDCSPSWKELSENLSTDQQREHFEKVISELLSGLVHSMLVTLDGGSSLADTTLITVQDDDGHEFKRFLHEFWPVYSGSVKNDHAV